MARNMQSIISAAMKNEGLSRLMSVYEEGGLAQKYYLKIKKKLEIWVVMLYLYLKMEKNLLSSS